VPDQWYDVHIMFDGTTLTVMHGVYGGALSTIITADLTGFETEGDVAFGKGRDAEFKFDDLRLFAASLDGTLASDRRYEYDALGRRVMQTVIVDGVPANTWFVYDGDRVIEEYLEDGGMRWVNRYVYGQYIDEVLQRDFDLDGDTAADEVYYYLHDDLYNVVAVTDASGDLVERYEYGEYGKPTVFDENCDIPFSSQPDFSAIGNRYLFNGREYDSRTGHYWYRTRYMDPEQGRFIARDTIGPWGDPNNLGNPFAYVGNNPWTHLDPYGESLATDAIARIRPGNHEAYLKNRAVSQAWWGGAGEGVRNASVIVYDNLTIHQTNMYYLAQEIREEAKANNDILSQVGFGFARVGDTAGKSAFVLGTFGYGATWIGGMSVGGTTVAGVVEGAMIAHPTIVAGASYAGAGLMAASAASSGITSYRAFQEGAYETGIGSAFDAGLATYFGNASARFGGDFRTIGKIVRSEGSTQGIHHSSFTTALQASRMKGDLGQAAGRTSGAATAMQQGRVIVTKQSSGGVVRTHHPTVRRALETSSRPHAGTFGHCGEPACASVFARAGINPRGADYVTTRIRKPGHRAHGTIIIPCRHCESMINSLGR